MYTRTWFLSAFALLFLSGCGTSPQEMSRMLAVSPTRLEAMPKDSQNTLMHAYRSNLTARQRAVSQSHTSSPRRLSVEIRNGTAAIAPTYTQHKFTPKTVAVFANQCQEVSLEDAQDRKQYAHLMLCYLNNQLYIDPSSTNTDYPVGSVIIPINTDLANSQSFCDLNTQGNARLRQSCVTISMANQPAKSAHKMLHMAAKNKTFTPKLREETDEFDDE